MPEQSKTLTVFPGLEETRLLKWVRVVLFSRFEIRVLASRDRRG